MAWYGMAFRGLLRQSVEATKNVVESERNIT